MAEDYERLSSVAGFNDAIDGVLSSDMALEIKAEFEGRLSAGFDVQIATEHVFRKFHAALLSPQEGPVVLLALAALQVREEYLQRVIRDAGVDLIQSGEALNAYRSMDAGQRKATGLMLNGFAEILSNAKVHE